MELHDDIREYVVPTGILGDEGWQDVQSFIVGKLGVRVDRQAIGDDWTAREGKFPKRVAKYLHKQGIKAPPELVSEIGNIAARHTGRVSRYEIDFTRSIDWSAGEFGDGGSCFWGTHAAARDMLESNGAYAVRFWRGERGIGRAWLAPLGEALLAFNAYGPHSLLTIGRILAHAAGWTYRYVKLENNSTTTGTLYVNGGNAIAIGPADVLEDLGERIDLQWEDEGERCECCGCDCTDEYDVSPNGERLCWECFSEHYTSCGYCGEASCHEDVHRCGDDWYCEHCAERKGFSPCYACAEWSQSVYECTDGEHRCEDCIGDWSPCDECGLLADEIARDQQSG